MPDPEQPINYHRPPQGNEELERSCDMLSIAVRRYTDSAPWILDFSVDQARLLIKLSFTLTSKTEDDLPLISNNEALNLPDFMKLLNHGIADINSGFELDCLQQFRRGVAAIQSIATILKLDFPDGALCEADAFNEGQYFIFMPPTTISSLAHLEKIGTELELSYKDFEKMQASAELIGSVLKDFIDVQGINPNIKALLPHPSDPSLTEFTISLSDPSGEDRVTSELVDDFLEKLSSLGLTVSKTAAHDPVDGDLILLGNWELRELIIHRGILWGE